MNDVLMTLRDEILLAALPHIPFEGWTNRSMRQGALDAGYDIAAADRAFPYGSADMIAHYGDLADRRMMEELTRRGVAQMKVRERIAIAIRVRLEQAAAHKEAVRRALFILALPANTTTALRSLYRTVDTIWVAAGDTATDWNFYSKRSLLAGVFSATMLCWLDDRSRDNAETWAFLDRRIADVMRLPKLAERVQNTCGRLARRIWGRPYRQA